MNAISRAWKALTQKRSYPPNWLVRLFGDWDEGYSGVAVSKDQALKYCAFYCAVDLISSDLAKLPLFLYKRTDGEGEEKARTHPVFQLIYSRPNPEQTSFIFRKTLEAWMLIGGNAYAEIVRNGIGQPVALWPMNPDTIRVERTESGELRYIQRLENGSERPFRPDQILHIRTMGNGVVGRSRVSLFKDNLGLAIAAERAGASFFKNMLRPSGVLEHPGVMDEDAYNRLRKSIEENNSGSANAAKLLILEEGMKWHQMAIPPTDAQFLETRVHGVRDVARIFHLPPHKLADLADATFCLPASAQILTSTGPKNIIDVQPGHMVWSPSTSGEMQLKRVIRSGCTGSDKILSIRTQNRMVRANAKHRMLVRRKVSTPSAGKGGWQKVSWINAYVPAGELRRGDLLVVAQRTPAAGTAQAPTGRECTVGFMELCGLYVGDGNIMKSGQRVMGICIARAANVNYMDHYKNIMRTEFTCLSKDRKELVPVALKEQARATRFSSKHGAQMMLDLGFGGTAHTKRVPEWVFGLSEHLRLAFLRGFLDADGSVDKKGRISFSSCNKLLLHDIRALCMCCGVPVTNLRCQEGVALLPNGQQKAYKQYSFTCSDTASNGKIGSNDMRYVDRFAAGKPFSCTERTYPDTGGRGFALRDCGLSRVVSITEEPEEPVYDLEVEDNHCFVCDGVIVHNSNVEEQNIDYVGECLEPDAVQWEQEIEFKLLMPEEASRYFVRHNFEGMLRGNSTARAQFYSQMFNIGAFSINEIRRYENLNSIGEAGDKHYVPVNLQTAENAARGLPAREEDVTDIEAVDDEEDVRGRRIVAALRAPLTDTSRRVVRMHAAILRRAPGSTQDAVAAIRDDTGRDKVERMLYAQALAMAAALGLSDYQVIKRVLRGAFDTYMDDLVAAVRVGSDAVAVWECTAPEALAESIETELRSVVNA